MTIMTLLKLVIYIALCISGLALLFFTVTVVMYSMFTYNFEKLIYEDIQSQKQLKKKTKKYAMVIYIIIPIVIGSIMGTMYTFGISIDNNTKLKTIKEKEEVISKQDEQIEYIDYELDMQESRNSELEGEIEDLEETISDLENSIYEFIELYPEHEDFFYDALLKAGSSISEESIGAKHAKELPY